MIPVKLYDDIQNLKSKPTSYQEFLYEIEQLFSVNDPGHFTYEYLTNDNEYFILDMSNYPIFYINDNVKQIFMYVDKNEANISLKEEEEKPSENRIVIEEDSNPNFYEDDCNNNEKNDINKDESLKNLIKQKIINQQKEKIRQSKLLMESQEREEEEEKEEKEEKEEEDKNMEIILNENKNNQEALEINENSDNKIIINDENMNENPEISNKINDILNKNFEQLKEELINESKIKFNEIIMESTIKREDNEEEEDDNIQTPCSVEKHKGITCSGCGECPIVGIRYKCVFCPHFDYCEKCEEEKGSVHSHPLYKLRFTIN